MAIVPTAWHGTLAVKTHRKLDLLGWPVAPRRDWTPVDLAVVLEHRFWRTPDGTVWTETAFSHRFFERYLKAFDAVHVMARVLEVHHPQAGWAEATGTDVDFIAVPHYVGPLQYARARPAVERVARQILQQPAAVLLRVPSPIGGHLSRHLIRSARPYAVEVIGDPADVFARGVMKHPARPFFRRHLTSALAGQCKHATCAAYVTEDALQRRYPPSPDAFTTHYSSVELGVDWLVSVPPLPRPHGPFRLVFVGSLEQLYKGPDVLLRAVALCRKQGAELSLAMVGEGRYQTELEQLAWELGITHDVEFRGQVPGGSMVRSMLDESDLFVLPSRTEGLPRALIEAMARGLPCIASCVGGIPELLPADDLVTPGDAEDLAARIISVAQDPARRQRMGERNLLRAQEFRDDVLDARRTAFYAELERRTTRWMQHEGQRFLPAGRPRGVSDRWTTSSGNQR